MDENSGRFNYVYSCELDTDFEIKIGSLEGTRPRPGYKELLDNPMGFYSGAYQEGCSDLFVTVQIFKEGRPITLPVQTSYKAFTTRWNWNEWLKLPIKFSDLPREAVLACTIWDYYGTDGKVAVGASVIPIFGKRGTLKKGMHDLRVWPECPADPNIPSQTSGKSKDSNDKMSQLAKLVKKHRDGHMIKIDWLDRLTFREIEMVNEQEKRDSKYMYLMVEFPKIHYDGLEYSAVYFEKDGDNAFEFRTTAEICTLYDPELMMDNIVEAKHHKLARSLRSGPSDRDLKPDAKTRDILNKIVGYPPTQTLTSEEQDLVWKFRFYLSSQKEALAKFLKSVNWKLPQESTAALEMLMVWSPMNVADALELLSPIFTHPKVRKYAVMRLQQANDEDLVLYLLQLVQALKYENFDEIKNRSDRDFIAPRSDFENTAVAARKDSDVSHLTEQVVGLEIHPLGPVMNVSSTSSDGDGKSRSDSSLTEKELLDAMNSGPSAKDENTSLDEEMDLVSFLISRACKNPVVANYFYWVVHSSDLIRFHCFKNLLWYLIVECEDHPDMQNVEVVEMYKTVWKRLGFALSKGTAECKRQRVLLTRQKGFLDGICGIVKHLQKEGSQKKKIERLQALLHDSDIVTASASNFEAIPLPIDPTVMITSIVPDKSTVFSSKLSPCLLTFQTDDSKEYKAIFKFGDDLRQDQLILQMFQLMDKLLRHENLDLQLTPYKVLATSTKHGFIQYIESIPLSEVSREKAIQKFLRQHNPSSTGPYGIAAEVMDNYVKSCAGYCVLTYLLQIGDRHLDNLMLTKTGKMFHIDFGFILGRDPKIMAPPMKLNRQMVEAMGGYESEHFQSFKVFAYTAFLALRRSVNLFLNLFSLMIDTSIPDIALEPDKTVKKCTSDIARSLGPKTIPRYIRGLVVSKVQEKFMLNLNDEQAVQHIQMLIDESVNAFMPTLMEYGHKMAQALRK